MDRGEPKTPVLALSGGKVRTAEDGPSASGSFSLSPYEQGIIFGVGFELRWRSVGLATASRTGIDKILVHYIGRSLSEHAPLQEVAWTELARGEIQVREARYVLWGERLANGLYGEGRLPIEIDYPVDGSSRRVCLIARVYVEQATGRPIAQRWLRLEGIE